MPREGAGIIAGDTLVGISNAFSFFYEKRRRGILRVSIRYYRGPVSSSRGWLELLCFTQVQRRRVLSSRGGISCRRFCTRCTDESSPSLFAYGFNASSERETERYVLGDVYSKFDRLRVT